VIGYNYLTADQRVSDRKITLYRVIVTPTSAGIGTATLRNGANTSAEVFLPIRTPSAVTLDLDFGPGVTLDRGLYIDVGDRITGILVVWEKED